MGNHPTQELNESGNFECLRHSNWTICITLGPSSSKNFQTFLLSYWEANSYYPRGLIMGNGESPNSRIEWEWHFSVPGAFKLDRLQPIEPTLSLWFSNFSTFILGGQFLLPQRANNGKREFTQLQNWMRQRIFSAWGILIGLFSAHGAHLALEFFQLFNFHTGRPILITPEGQ